jgi:hypothetical protein
MPSIVGQPYMMPLPVLQIFVFSSAAAWGEIELIATDLTRLT